MYPFPLFKEDNCNGLAEEFSLLGMMTKESLVLNTMDLLVVSSAFGVESLCDILALIPRECKRSLISSFPTNSNSLLYALLSLTMMDLSHTITGDN